MRVAPLAFVLLAGCALGGTPLADRDASLSAQLSPAALTELRLASPATSIIGLCRGTFDARPSPQWAVLSFDHKTEQLRLFVVAEPKPGLASSIQVTETESGFAGHPNIANLVVSYEPLRCISSTNISVERSNLVEAKKFGIEGSLSPEGSMDLMLLAPDDANSTYFQWNNGTKAFSKVGWRSN